MAADSRKFPRAIERVCETFKISSLYPEQETSLKALVEGKNVYASLPTGYGKLLIFFAAPVLFHEILERPRGSSKILSDFTVENADGRSGGISEILRSFRDSSSR